MFHHLIGDSVDLMGYKINKVIDSSRLAQKIKWCKEGRFNVENLFYYDVSTIGAYQTLKNGGVS